MDHEREQIGWVFGLTGGELSDVPWEHLHGADGASHDALALHAMWYDFAYWYEGAPEYSERDFDEFETIRTVVAQELYGVVPNWLVEPDGSVWKRVGSFTSSGEAECPGKHEDGPGLVTDAHCAGGDRCVLCDEAKGEAHGYIYLGEGWSEIVYALQEVSDEALE